MTLTPKEKDAIARVLWTILQVGIPTAAVYVGKLPVEWIPLGTVILAVLKNLVTAHTQVDNVTKEPS